jgi:hypothetical protein
MEIKKDAEWNVFHIPIEPHENETEEAFMERVYKCLMEFYEEHTQRPKSIRAQVARYWGDPPSFKVPHNFCDMDLDGIPFCDVKYFVVFSPSDSWSGIKAYSHRDDRDRHEPMIKFVMGKWEDFDYSF